MGWFFAAEPEESTLPYVMERIGDDKADIRIDYRTGAGTFLDVVSTIRERKDISDGARQKLLGENARNGFTVGIDCTHVPSANVSVRAAPSGIGSVKNLKIKLPRIG